ncbi:SRPBCC family protein [Hyalangium versicolor]|uniref:SRPBCC family protein n=1 Tax=Hyalangium versicolor TaxID=2861190 RepID=UPI001CC936EC|nr:SRPBCC family protein [Hyalangium versicolor]
MGTTNTDRIEKKTLLRAPRSRVWRALTNAEEFGNWFGVRLSGEFAPGARLKGKVTHPGYEHVPFEITVERMEPERLFSWRGPLTVKPDEPPSAQPTTLVVFELEEVPGGTQLTVTESGFDQIPLSHRTEAYRGNEQGWAIQMEAIGRYLGHAA